MSYRSFDFDTHIPWSALIVGTVFLAACMTLSVRSAGLSLALGFVPLAVRGLMTRIGPLLAIVGGSLLVFQSSQAISGPKLAVFALYFGFFVLATGSKSAHLASDRDRILVASLAGFVVLAGSLLTSRLHDNRMVDAFRDVLPYAMLLLAPIVGLHAASRARQRTLDRLFALTTLVSALITFSVWASRRGIIGNSFANLGLASYLLPLTGLCYGLRRQKIYRPSVLWTVSISCALVALILTGTRTNVLAVPAIAYSLWGRHDDSHRQDPGRSKTRRFRGRRVVIGLLVALAINFLAKPDWAVLGERVTLLVRGSGQNEDASSVERRDQTQIVLREFRENPLVGAGPGTVITTYRRTSRTTVETITVDSPFGVLGDYGLMALVLYLAIGSSIWRAVRGNGLTRSGVVSLFLLVGANSVLLSPLEDKGVTVAVVLLSASSFVRDPWSHEIGK